MEKNKKSGWEIVPPTPQKITVYLQHLIMLVGEVTRGLIADKKFRLNNESLNANHEILNIWLNKSSLSQIFHYSVFKFAPASALLTIRLIIVYG